RKNTSFPQLLSIDSENPEILLSAAFNIDDNLTSYSGKVDSSGGHWYLDGKPHKGRIKVKSEFINPFDSFQFHNIAAFRRSWMDGHISDLLKSYKQALSRYNQSLKIRNQLIFQKGMDYK